MLDLVLHVVDEMAQAETKRGFNLNKAQRCCRIALISDLTTGVRRARLYVIVPCKVPGHHFISLVHCSKIIATRIFDLALLSRHRPIVRFL